MTEEEKLDLILQEYKDRLSRHHPEKVWEKISLKVIGSENYKSSAFQIYVTRLRSENLIAPDVNGDLMATHHGLTFEGFQARYNRLEAERLAHLKLENRQSEQDGRLEKLQSRMVTLTYVLAGGALVAAIYYLLEIWKFYHPSCHH